MITDNQFEVIEAELKAAFAPHKAVFELEDYRSKISGQIQMEGSDRTLKINPLLVREFVEPKQRAALIAQLRKQFDAWARRSREDPSNDHL